MPLPDAAPILDDRLRLREDGRVELGLKTPWRDGTVALILTPERLVARLAALVPRPEKNLVRYHGVFAPNASDRAAVVPAAGDASEPEFETSPGPRRPRTGRYLLWAELLKRVFEVDVLECPRCRGRLRLICAVVDARSARRYLAGTGRAEPEPAARPPP